MKVSNSRDLLAYSRQTWSDPARELTRKAYPDSLFPTVEIVLSTIGPRVDNEEIATLLVSSEEQEYSYAHVCDGDGGTANFAQGFVPRPTESDERHVEVGLTNIFAYRG